MLIIPFLSMHYINFYYAMLHYVRMSFPFISGKYSYKGQPSDMIIYESVVSLGTPSNFL